MDPTLVYNCEVKCQHVYGLGWGTWWWWKTWNKSPFVFEENCIKAELKSRIGMAKKPSSWMTLINNGQDFYLPCERETVRTGVGGVGPLVDLSSANKENACPTGEASQG